MFGSITVYLGLGLIASAAGFMYLFRKYDLPGYCRRTFRLYTNMTSLVFGLVVGIGIAFLSSVVLSMLKLPAIPTQILEGVFIGFNCALLVGLVRPSKTSGGSSQEKAKKDGNSKGRRSKG